MSTKYVIQCAASKNAKAGCLKSSDGKFVKFVAQPDLISNENVIYARPDDMANGTETWRDKLNTINSSGHNPDSLLPAYKLYSHPSYKQLVEKFGVKNVYILSAGWGLVKSDFLLPDYNITFSNVAPRFAKRVKKDFYNDYTQIDCNEGDVIVFVGGKDYQELFIRLTNKCICKKIIFYNSTQKPKLKDVEFIKYETRTRTNWHYEPAKDLIADIIKI